MTLTQVHPKPLSSILILLILTLLGCQKDPIPVSSIAIDSSLQSVALLVNESQSLRADIIPSDAADLGILWRSDDETIALISSTGVVTGLKAGRTLVWAISTMDPSIKDSSEVIVTERVVDVSEVILDLDTLCLEVAQTRALLATILPDDASNRNLYWSSSDSTIVTVSKTGHVTGHQVGKASITVRSESNPSIFASCDITVMEASIPATDMWMKTSQVDLQIGQNIALEAVTIPTNASDQTMVWSSDDESVVSVSPEGILTGLKAGTTTVWVQWGPNTSIKDKCRVTVLAASSYQVGDLYPSSEAPIGVVFWKDPNDPLKGKIVSLTEARLAWSDEFKKCEALDEHDGASNLSQIQLQANWEDLYPAFQWCSSQGQGWYLPAIAEVKALYDKREAIREAIMQTEIEGAVPLDESKDYWTSTELSSSSKSFAVTIQFYEGFGGGGAPAGGAGYDSKEGLKMVRAIQCFEGSKP